MKKQQIIAGMVKEHPELAEMKEAINNAVAALIESFSKGGKLLVCGNGGSASQAGHMVAELMKSFEEKRILDESFRKRLKEISPERGSYLAEKLEHSLPSIDLTSQTALMTAISNDTDASMIFAQQVIGFGNEKDVLFAISTSGNSQNVVDACITARALNMTVIGITGQSGGKLRDHCNILLNVPATRTATVQELQLIVIHAICAIIETHFYGK